ncbi:hypothetical protein BC831DRAFT_153310 [Entophlyctis helioformis]|nr:hypothetical protein BC831DRAFT_153310 [Entophlyctis helioformis]
MAIPCHPIPFKPAAVLAAVLAPAACNQRTHDHQSHAIPPTPLEPLQIAASSSTSTADPARRLARDGMVLLSSRHGNTMPARLLRDSASITPRCTPTAASPVRPMCHAVRHAHLFCLADLTRCPTSFKSVRPLSPPPLPCCRCHNRLQPACLPVCPSARHCAVAAANPGRHHTLPLVPSQSPPSADLVQV